MTNKMKTSRRNARSFLENDELQMTIVGLLMIFLIIIVLSILMPTILTYVDYTADNLTLAGYPQVDMLTRLIPLFLVCVLLATIAMYGTPRL